MVVIGYMRFGPKQNERFDLSDKWSIVPYVMSSCEKVGSGVLFS